MSQKYLSILLMNLQKTIDVFYVEYFRGPCETFENRRTAKLNPCETKNLAVFSVTVPTTILLICF